MSGAPLSIPADGSPAPNLEEEIIRAQSAATTPSHISRNLACQQLDHQLLHRRREETICAVRVEAEEFNKDAI